MNAYWYQTGELYCQQHLSVSDCEAHPLRLVREVLNGLKPNIGEGGFTEGCLAQIEMLKIQWSIRDEFYRLALPKFFE